MRDKRSMDLPPRKIQRWLPRRKWQVVTAVHSGLMKLDEACERYQLSLEEFRSWERSVDAHGVEGLRLSQSQTHKSTR
jgi:Protein of unknown function (DUF1153)